MPRRNFECDKTLQMTTLSDDSSLYIEKYDNNVVRPIDRFDIYTQGQQPLVGVSELNGLEVDGSTMRLLGSCTLDEWHERGRLSVPKTTEEGLIVPGKRYLLQELQGHQAVHLGQAMIKGWATQRFMRKPFGLGAKPKNF